MANKQVGSKPGAISALAPIAEALIESYLGPDHKVIDMERFLPALMQALQDAYTLGWKDRARLNGLNDSRQARTGRGPLSQSRCDAVSPAQPSAKPT